MSPPKAIAVLTLLFCLPAAARSRPTPGGQAAALLAREKSGDIVYSDEARGRGVRLALVDKPARFAAGMSVPAGVAGLYGAAGGGTGVLSQTGGKKAGWDQTADGPAKGDHNDDGHADNGNHGGSQTSIDNELISNNEFAQGLAYWDNSGGDSAYTTTEFGPIRADAGLSKDGIFAVAHNGYHADRAQGHLQQQVQVPLAREANFSMLYNFVTTEYPAWVGSEFNDNFKLTLTGPSGEMTLSKAEFLNSGSFQLVAGVPLAGWDYAQNGDVLGGQTGWQVFSFPRLPLKSGIYSLRIEVNDLGDEIVDSAILVDRVSLR